MSTHASESAAEDAPEPVEGALAPTVAGQREVVSETLSLADHRPEVSGHLRTNVLAMYGALVRSDAPLSPVDLRDYFSSFGSEAPKQALYASFEKWLDGAGYESEPGERSPGREQLIALPGVVAHHPRDRDRGRGRTGALAFVGFTDEDVDRLGLDREEHVAPLADHRASPRTVVRRHLDEAVGPHSEEHADLLVLWDALRDEGRPVTVTDIKGDYTLPSLTGGLGDRLADLPGIERERVDRRAEDVVLADLETLADLREAQERVEGPTETTFEYTGLSEE